MSRFVHYLKATRPRTLLLSISSILMGAALPYVDFEYGLDWKLVLLLVLTACFLQILSNVANELGDYRSGTDTSADRVGPHYSLSTGALEEKDFKIMIVVYIILSALAGAGAVYLAFGTFWDLGAFVFLLGGAVAIKAATQYSLGMDNYGRRGLGDLYVFIFFGPVAVLGTYFLCASQSIGGWYDFLPAVAVGLFNVAVLNINNIRDMDSDEELRSTIPVRIGEKKAKIYHLALVIGGWAAMLGWSVSRSAYLKTGSPWLYLYVLALPLFIHGMVKVWKTDRHQLDPCLPLMVISTALFCLLTVLGTVFFVQSL